VARLDWHVDAIADVDVIGVIHSAMDMERQVEQRAWDLT
jgi:hypothetical protein